MNDGEAGGSRGGEPPTSEHTAAQTAGQAATAAISQAAAQAATAAMHQAATTVTSHAPTAATAQRASLATAEAPATIPAAPQRSRAHSTGEQPSNRDPAPALQPASHKRQRLDSDAAFVARQSQAVMAQVTQMLTQLQHDSVSMKQRQDAVLQQQADAQRRQMELQNQQTIDIQRLSQAVTDLGRRITEFEQPLVTPGTSAVPARVQPAYVGVGATIPNAPTTASNVNTDASTSHTQPQSATAGTTTTGGSTADETPWSSAPHPPTCTENPLLQRTFDLPPFSGKPSQWPMFITAYRQTTAAFGYTALQNLYRLQKCLTGEALHTVEALLLKPDTIETAISSLELRFGRPQLLACEQIKQIRQHPHVRENNYEEIIEYSTCVSNVVAYLDTDETRHTLHEQSLLVDMLSKLPPTRRYEWLQYSETIAPLPTAIEFGVWLKMIAVRLSKMPLMPSTSTLQPRQPPAGGRQRDERRVLLNVGDSCRMCSRQHSTFDCSLFKRLRVKQRWRAARRFHMCFACLHEGHSFNECDNDENREYHQMLRDEENGEGEENGGSEPNRSRDRDQPIVQVRGNASTADAVAATSRSSSDGDAVKPTYTNPFAGPNIVNTVGLCLDGPEQSLYFRVVPVTLHGPHHSVDTFALLDEGSSVTLLDTDMAKQLMLDGPTRQLNIKWIGNQSSSVQSKSLELSISGVGPSCTRHMLRDVRTVSNLHLPTQTVALSPGDERFDHLRDLPIATYRNATPSILIGLDNCHLGAASKTRVGKNGGLVAAKTSLGWIVYGQGGSNAGGHVLHCREEDEQLAALELVMNDFQTTESFGVMAPKSMVESDDDMRARSLLAATTVRVGKGFQTGLLWRTDDVHLPDSFSMAMRRYNMVARKIRRDAEYGRLYADQMNALVAKNYARKLSPAEARVRDDRTWFLPHFGVQSVHKPGKLRIVFDAAATVHQTSLNSVLLKGPDLNQSLLAILMQFRMRPIGVCADICEMFLQVGMRPEDRRAQRYLWRDDGGSPPDVYEMQVMTFGAACSPTAAQYAKNLNATEFEADYPEAAEIIKKHHYVDDMVSSFDTEADAIRITRDVCEVHRRGGFTLRGFVSNSVAVVRELGAGHGSDNTVDMELDDAACSKILGMRWATQRDSFVFTTDFAKLDPALFDGARTPSKREMLSAIMSVFDPFGFLSDVMLPTKLLMQELWKLGVSWDAPVPAAIDNRWRAWCDVLRELKTFAVPRCYSPHLLSAPRVELHCFADASEEAFAAAIYWRILHDDDCTVSFVAGKTRAAPLKQLSVPRLELQAAVMATRLHNAVLEFHPVHVVKSWFWTDSRTVLLWLKSTERRFRPFVSNRVSEVLDSTRADCWRWVPTKDNVADDATRSRAATRIDAERRWIRGPEFLRRAEVEWPVIPDSAVIDGGEVEEEIRPRFVGSISTADCNDFIRRYSSFHKLSRVVAWMRRFVFNGLASRRTQKDRTSGPLTAGELWAATVNLCRVAQADGFASEHAALSSGGKISRSSSIASLVPMLDGEGTMRLDGRTDLADPAYLPVSAQRPILLPNRHRITELIVSMHHARMAHQFEGSTMTSLRAHFWIPHLRAMVRRIRRSCLACKLRSARPMPPIAGQLPTDRMSPHLPPFSFTGVDYFGPVIVAVGRKREKRWVCLFTCLTVRAVHLEVAEDLSADACLVCVRNFISIRGKPVRFRSDCGTNFVGADNELKKMGDVFDCEDVHDGVSAHGVEWRFNCPANPEAGGSWERLVQSTKKVLAVTLREVTPRVETLRCYLNEAANLINSRPLTDVPVSPDEMAPLTPNHFLLGRVNLTTATSEFAPRELCHRKQWRVLTQLKNHFWKRWVEEYLPTLTRRDKQCEEVLLKEGDLALICDANQTRGQWLRGRVVSVRRGPDGRVRTAELQTKDGLKQRPVSKLAVLDVMENQ